MNQKSKLCLHQQIHKISFPSCKLQEKDKQIHQCIIYLVPEMKIRFNRKNKPTIFCLGSKKQSIIA